LHNPAPLAENILLIAFFESLLTALVLYAIIELRKAQNGTAFFVILFCAALLARYSPSYSMFLLLPCVLFLIAEGRNRVLLAACILCLALAINVPLSKVEHLPLAFQFIRLWGLLLFFVGMLFYLGLTLRFMPLCLFFVPVFCIRYLSFPVKEANYFRVQNSKGILYDYAPKGDSITLYSTLGDHTLVETVPAGGKLRADPALQLRENEIFYQGKKLACTGDNKSKPCMYNDSMVLFMSDLNQGIRFYVLRTVPLR